MPENLSVSEALKKLELESVLDLTISHVEEVIRNSSEVKIQPLAEYEFWEAFHIIREFTNRQVKVLEENSRRPIQPESNFEKRQTENNWQTKDNSSSIQIERREIRKNLGNLIFKIRSINTLQSELLVTVTKFEEASRELQQKSTGQDLISQDVQIMNNKILDLERKIAALHNDRTANLSSEEKLIKQNSLRKKIQHIKQIRSQLQFKPSSKLIDYERKVQVAEGKLIDVKNRLTHRKKYLEDYCSEVRLFTCISLNEKSTERILFLGPFVTARNCRQFEYVYSASKIGQQLLGKKPDEGVSLDNKTISISNIRLPDPNWLELLMFPDHWEGGFTLDLPQAGSHIELWSRSPGFGNNSRHIWG